MSPLQLLSLLVAIAALFGWMSVRVLRLPLTIGTMLLTVALSLALAAAGHWVPGLHLWALGVVDQIHFEGLILHGMLALLLFAGAFLLELKFLFREKLVVGLLAIFGTLLTFVAVAALMHFALAALGIPSDWIACFFFGALISPTDPIAVLEMLRRSGAPKALQAQLAGESLFNDGIGAVIFLTVLGISRGTAVSSPRMVPPIATQIAATLLWQVGGAVALGCVAAWVTSSLMCRVRAYQIDILLTLALALGGYALAEALHFSAPLEAVIAALALRWLNARQPEELIAHESIDRFWEAIDEVQNAVLFVLLGLEVLAIPFSPRYFGSGAAAVVAVNATRFAVIALVLGLMRLCGRGCGPVLLPLTWGGLRGGLSIALALAVPPGPARAWILATTYLVVVFSVVLQGGSMDLFLRRFKISAADA